MPLHKKETYGALLITSGSLLVMIVGEITQISASINTATLSEMVF